MKKKLKLYEIRLPIKETWLFEVMATSKKHALAMHEKLAEQVEQTCTLGGWPLNKDGKEASVVQIIEVNKES